MVQAIPRRSMCISTVSPAVALDPSGIPNELKELDRWVAWRSNPRPGKKKPEKVPVNPDTGRPANHSDRRTWGRFDRALRRWQDDDLAGIGFVFANDGFAGVDLDGCRNAEGGDLDPWADELVQEFGTYTEISPSGTGVKLIVRGRLDPKGRRRNGPIEVYDHSRFFALTGCRLVQAPDYVAACQAALLALQRRLHPPTHKTFTAPSVDDGGFDGPDTELLNTAFSARNGDRVRTLWGGNCRSHPSSSESLLALAGHLAFYTGPDVVRLERIILGSPLFALTEAEREKWHSSREGGTWGQVYVVRKAISTCRTFYSGSKCVGHKAYTGLGFTLPSPGATSPELVSERSRSVSESGNAVKRAWAKVEAGEYPSEALLLTDISAQKLAALCFHLGKRSGGKFFLGVRTAGKLLGVSKNTAARRLKLVITAELIRVVRKGRYHPVADIGLGTEFQWVGKQQA